LKIEVHRVGVWGLFRASRFGGCELAFSALARRVTTSYCMSKRSANGLSNRSGPEMITRFGVDELDVDAHAVSAALDAALEDTADVQLAPDRLCLERLALVCERRMAGDHDRASNARKIGRS
jgi:hypothetical protein